MTRYLLYGAAVALALGTPAKAAEIVTDVVSGIQWISVFNEISPGDFEIFRSKANQINGNAAVMLNGPGGNLVEAIKIGEFVRLRGWNTYAPEGCYSSCALIWLAGAQRVMKRATSIIGFHAASIDGQEKGVVNAMIGAYLSRLGLSYAAIGWATTASPTEISYLTPDRAKELGIDIFLLGEDRAAVTQSTASAVVRDCSAISVELRNYFPEQFGDCAKQPAANRDRATDIFATKKTWDRFVPSSGRYITRIVQKCTASKAFGCLSIHKTARGEAAYSMHRLIAMDHDVNGGSNGGSVCYFDETGWSDCENSDGGHYKLGAGSVKTFLAIANGAAP